MLYEPIFVNCDTYPLIFAAALHYKYYAHFMNEDTESHRAWAVCPRSCELGRDLNASCNCHTTVLPRAGHWLYLWVCVWHRLYKYIKYISVCSGLVTFSYQMLLVASKVEWMNLTHLHIPQGQVEKVTLWKVRRSLQLIERWKFFCSQKSNMEKDIEADVRKVEGNVKHLTLAAQTDDHWNSIYQEIAPLCRSVLIFESSLQ